MRVRKRFYAEKIRKIGWIPGIWVIFFGALVLPKWLLIFRFLRVLCSGNVLQNFFPEVTEFLFGDGAARGE